MEKWIFDSPDLPGEVFRQFIKDCYQGNKLIQSQLEVDGQRVDLKKLTMPLLNIYGKYDHLVPPEACEQLVKHVGSTDTEDLCLDTGHIGIYVSSKFQEAFAPKIANWLKERDQDPEKKPSHTKKTTAKSSAGLKKTVRKTTPDQKTTRATAKPKSSRSKTVKKATHG
jgi:polyhydroxyalkanoate synthase